MRKIKLWMTTTIAFFCVGLFCADLNRGGQTTGEIVIRINQSTGTINSVEDENGQRLLEVGKVGSPAAGNERKKFKNNNNKHGRTSRFSTIPVELWEKVGNTICYIKVGNTVFKKPC